MGKMSKEKIEELKHDDVKDNNWEIEPVAGDQGSMVSKSVINGQGSVISDVVPIKSVIPDELLEVFEMTPDGTITDTLIRAVEQVDPAIRENNPLWVYSIKQDNMMTRVTMIFKNGQKVRVLLPENENHGTV